ncbi:MAG TPA: hypothetical protein VIA18_22605 [Polyangia bacterium]|jgi:hypothetical protein|nr:hypothetical protein [Polyangia bacterium]
METKNRLMMKITLGVAAAGLSILSLLPAQLGPAPMNEDETAKALVYGRANDAWTTRAADLATSDGAFAAKLGQLAQRDGADSLSRDRVIDALAKAGTPAAQKAMRATLRTPAVKADGAYALMVARLGNLQSPTADTLEYLGQSHVDAVAAGDMQLALASEAALDSAFDHRLAQLSRHARRAPYRNR